MNMVDQLAEYYRLSQHAEVQNWLCRWWLPQGEARIAYLRELLEPQLARNLSRKRLPPSATATTPGKSTPE